MPLEGYEDGGYENLTSGDWTGSLTVAKLSYYTPEDAFLPVTTETGTTPDLTPEMLSAAYSVVCESALLL